MKTLECLAKLFIEKVTQYFWLSLFLSILTLLGVAHINSNFFSYKLFETNVEIAQAIIRFLLAFSFYQILLPFLVFIKNAIGNIIYENEKYEQEQLEIKRNKSCFIEELFSVERSPIYYNNIECHKLRTYLIYLYKGNLKQFAAMDIYKLFEKEADEKQRQRTSENYYYIPVLSEKDCIIVQNLLTKFGLLFFNGKIYTVDDLLFAKLKELDNRGILAVKR